jgi:hypothetical protein
VPRLRLGRVRGQVGFLDYALDGDAVCCAQQLEFAVNITHTHKDSVQATCAEYSENIKTHAVNKRIKRERSSRKRSTRADAA